MMIPADSFDRILEDWMVATAPSKAPAQLHERAMRLVRQRTQRASWSAIARAALADVPFTGGVGFGKVARVAALVVLVLVLGLLLAVAGGSKPKVEPTPSPSAARTAAAGAIRAASFVRPFSYQVPAEATFSLVVSGPALYGFAESGADGPRTDTNYGSVQDWSPQGVFLASADTLWVRVCRGVEQGRVQLRAAPADFVDDLHLVAGLAIEPVAPTAIDGRPTLTTAVTPARSSCTPDLDFIPRFGLGDQYIQTTKPAQLFVVNVADKTILIGVWAQTDEQLAGWLPTARHFLDSIHFE